MSNSVALRQSDLEALTLPALDEQLRLLGQRSTGSKPVKVLALMGLMGTLADSTTISEIRYLMFYRSPTNRERIRTIKRELTSLSLSPASLRTEIVTLNLRVNVRYYRKILSAVLLSLTDEAIVSRLNPQIIQIWASLDESRTRPQAYTASQLFELSFRDLDILATSLGINSPVDQTREFYQILARELHRTGRISDQEHSIVSSNDYWRIYNLPSNRRRMLIRAYSLQNRTGNHEASLRLFNNGIYEVDIQDIENGREFLRGARTVRRSWVGISTEVIPSVSRPTYVEEARSVSNESSPPPRPSYGPPIPENPYTYLPNWLLLKISQDRDVALPTVRTESYTMLQTLDEIEPDFITRVRSLTLETILGATRAQAALFAGRARVNIQHFTQDRYWSNLQTHIFLEILTPPNLIALQQPIQPRGSINPSLDVREQIRTAIGGNIPNIITTRLGKELHNLCLYPPRITPDEYLILRDLDDTLLRGHTPHFPYHEDLTKDSLIFAISRGYLPSDALPTEETLGRRASFRGLSESARSILFQLYRTDRLIEIAATQQHPLEPYIIALDRFSASEVAEVLGIQVPLDTEEEIYIRSNILDYKLLVERTETPPPIDKNYLASLRPERRLTFLGKYADSELFSYLEAYVDYTSRGDLLEKFSNLTTNPRFFYPLIRRPTNEETFFGTEMDDLSVPMIAYGTLTSYRCFEVQELISSFSLNKGTTIFRSPDLTRDYSREEMEQLTRVIRYYPEFSTLVQRITQGLVDVSTRNGLEQQMLRILSETDPIRRNQVRGFFIDLFQVGMYMRRWLGPGHPYPLATTKTQIEIAPEERSTPLLMKIQNTMKNASPEITSIYTALIIHELYGGNDRTGSKSFRSYFPRVIGGQECIRMASTVMIGTGCYYLQALFGERIPDFDPTTLTRIS